MDVRADRLVTLADDVDSVARGIEPSRFDDALTTVAGALDGARTASAARDLAASLGDRVRRWRDGLTGWAETARACAAGYDAVDLRTRTRFEQVAV